MKIVGIVFEANPFHYGHQYLINNVKKELNPDLILGITSGYFTMRGEVSILTKSNKTEILLNEGIDLVIDLPIYATLNSADKFAESSVKLLKEAGITDLAFSIEDGNIDLIKKVYDIEQTSSFNKAFILNQKIYQSYKKSHYQTLTEFISLDEANKISEPNMTLALAYYKATKNYGNIECHLFNRIGDSDNENELSNYPSGTAIRNAYYKKEDITSFIPYNIDKLTNVDEVNNNLSLLLKLLTTKDCNEFTSTANVSEGIQNYLIENIEIHSSYEENINNLCNKRYTKSRIRRTILSMMLEIPNNLNYDELPLRILGFNNKGSNYLKQIKDKIIVNIKQTNHPYLKYDIDACKLYSIITNHDYIMDEYRFPIKKGLENE